MEGIQNTTLLRSLQQVRLHVERGELELAARNLAQAAKFVRETSNLCDNEVTLWQNFGMHLVSTGETESLLDLLPKMVKIHPWPADLHSHMLLNLHHLPLAAF